MLRRIYGLPTPNHARVNSSAGIPQVVLALAKRLPEFGYELVETPDNTDIIAHHAGNGDGHTDIAVCHGLYPTGEPNSNTERWHYEANRRVIRDIIAAKRVTVPSQWVGDILRRDMHLEPTVLSWGVDLRQWSKAVPQGYVLWNKNRDEGVCTPEPLNRLAKMARDVSFVTTFGQAAPNVRVTGRVPHDEMRALVKGASVYLATTKETGDIGSREALAAGVPVLGFRHGAITDFVQHGVNGFLVAPNDYDGLLVGLRWIIEHHDQLSQNARKSAKAFTWRETAKTFAALCDEVLAEKAQDKTRPRCTVVIPCYNYGQYVTSAIESVLRQTETNIELIVVDDGSTDDSWQKINDAIKDDPRARAIQQQNAGVAHARNNAIAQASGCYIACMDADDMMRPDFVRICADALDNEPTVGIAYTKLQVIDGSVSAWPEAYDAGKLLTTFNQVPSLCMFRREGWERSGGYVQDKHPAEDADLWLRMAVLGFWPKLVTTEPLFNYRMHEQSASAPVRRRERPNVDWLNSKGWVKSGMVPLAAPHPKSAWPVRNYDQPKVSVIIPVGPGHTQFVTEAIRSLESQSFAHWECIVVNDSGEKINLAPYPFVRLLTTSGKQGAGVARNAGLNASVGETVLFLDADDYLTKNALAAMYEAYRRSGRYIYSDWYALEGTSYIYHETPEFTPGRMFVEGAFHAVSCLIPRHEAVKFDESMSSWEDVEYYMRLIAGGLCGQRVAYPALVYRMNTGQRRIKGLDEQHTLKPVIANKYPEYVNGRKEPVCGCRKMKTPPKQPDGELVEVRYNGPTAKHVLVGPATKKRYGRRAGGEVFYIYQQDADAAPDKFDQLTEVEDVIVPPTIPEAVLAL